MTGTVPRSFIVPTSFLPSATQRCRRSSSESRKFHSRSAAAELSIRSFSSRTIAVVDVPAQRSAVVGLATVPPRAVRRSAGPTRPSVIRFGGSIVHLQHFQKGFDSPLHAVRRAGVVGADVDFQHRHRAPLFQSLQLGVPEVAPHVAAEDDAPDLPCGQLAAQPLVEPVLGRRKASGMPSK